MALLARRRPSEYRPGVLHVVGRVFPSPPLVAPERLRMNCKRLRRRGQYGRCEVRTTCGKRRATRRSPEANEAPRSLKSKHQAASTHDCLAICPSGKPCTLRTVLPPSTRGCLRDHETASLMPSPLKVPRTVACPNIFAFRCIDDASRNTTGVSQPAPTELPAPQQHLQSHSSSPDSQRLQANHQQTSL